MKIKNYVKAAVFVLCVLCFFSLISCNFARFNYYIFDDISECENITKTEYTNAKLSRYDTPVNDNNLGNLEYLEFFGGYFFSDEIEFEIFAYEFKNTETTKQYFKNVTGKSTKLDSTYLHSSGFGTRLIVTRFESAYVVTMSNLDEKEVLKALEKVFSIQVETGNTSSSPKG